MSDDLIKQWDEYVKRTGSVMGEVEHMAQQMRDRIEQLERENAKLSSEVNIAKYGEPNFAWSIHNAIMADLQANLAKAVEIGNKMAASIKGNYYIPNVVAEWNAALDELEGE